MKTPILTIIFMVLIAATAANNRPVSQETQNMTVTCNPVTIEKRVPVTITSYNIQVLNDTEYFTHCEQKTAGCTDKRGNIWIRSLTSAYWFRVVCNHEVLHNMITINIDIDKEHELIRQLQDHVEFSQCQELTMQRYGHIRYLPED